MTLRLPPHLNEASDFLLEIGVEELPSADLDSALAQLRERVPALLDELRLAHGEVRIYGTPRRLVAVVDDLAPRQPDRTLVIKGPPADRALPTLTISAPGRSSARQCYRASPWISRP